MRAKVSLFLLSLFDSQFLLIIISKVLIGYQLKHYNHFQNFLNYMNGQFSLIIPNISIIFPRISQHSPSK